MLQRSDAAATRKYAEATMQLITILIPASVAFRTSIFIIVAIQISTLTNLRVENLPDWQLEGDSKTVRDNLVTKLKQATDCMSCVQETSQRGT